MDIIWDGVTRAETLQDQWLAIRSVLADSAKTGDSSKVLGILGKHTELTNTFRPGGKALYAPLHHAAYGGASVEVVNRLIELGAWRTLQNSRGERPVDVAERRDHGHLLDVLEPVFRRRVPFGILGKIQTHFHGVIRGRADSLVQQHALRLPELEPLLELVEPKMWFPIPGMYGGFSYWLESDGVEATLIAESWCRVEAGSGQRHEVTSEGSRLMDEGFV
jgi:hypothetical protein